MKERDAQANDPLARTETQLRQVQQATGAQRERLLADFIRSRQGQHRSLAASMLRYPGLTPSELPVLVSLVEECAALLVDKAGTPDGFPFDAYDAFLRVAAHHAIRAWAESAEATGFGGYTGAARRRRQLATAGKMLVPLLGRDPTPDEVLEAARSEASSKRANPVKQGALPTADDLIRRRIVPHDPDMLAAFAGTAAALDDEDSGPLHPLDARRDIGQVIRICSQRSERLGQVAVAWFAWYPDGDPVSVADVTEMTGLPRSTVVRMVERIRLISAEVFSQSVANSG